MCQNGAILTAMALARGDEFQATVAVDFVVPMLKPRHPLTRLADGIEGLVGKAGMIFQCFEQGLGIGVVVAHRGAAQRGHDPKSL